jgi:hypothetical protein
MDITKAFAELHKVGDADPKQVKEGRRRRDLFRAAFCPQDDVADGFSTSVTGFRFRPWNFRPGRRSRAGSPAPCGASSA